MLQGHMDRGCKKLVAINAILSRAAHKRPILSRLIKLFAVKLYLTIDIICMLSSWNDYCLIM